VNITISRTGYTFGGWFLDTQYTGPKITSGDYFTLDKGHTLYAKWNPKECTVNFVNENEQFTSSITCSYDQPCYIQENEPEKI